MSAAQPTTTGSSRSSLSSWRLTQVFGGEKAPGEEIPDADVVSCLSFDDSGEFLAAGDTGGRVVVFQRADTPKTESAEATDGAPEKRKHQKHGVKAEYRFFAEFQSHEAEFDCLKSMDVAEKIIQMKFLPRFNSGLMLLTTNEKTIKLWKVHQRSVLQPLSPTEEPTGVVIPKAEYVENVMSSDMKLVFANAHSYHINSVSLSTDQETFISADDLRIILWPFSCSKDAFNIVDIKPDDMEDLTVVITSATFSPTDCSQFAYSTSKGTVELCDLRSSALCDTPARTFGYEDDSVDKSYFSEIINSISDMKYTNDGRYILTRDFMSLRLWDLAMERQPVKTVKIHSRYEHCLGEFYDNDSIFDKFECAINHDGTQMVTGSYTRRFGIYDVNSSEYADMTASRVQPPRSHKSHIKKNPELETQDDYEEVDYAHKVMHVALHPKQNILAVTSLNNLFVFS